MEQELQAIVCALQHSIDDWLQSGHGINEQNIDNAAAEERLTPLLARVHAAEAQLAQRTQCLPLKQTTAVLEAVQRLWASTVHSQRSAPTESASLTTVAVLRTVLTHLFFIAHNFFSPTNVRDAYLRHHLAESEKGVLMCLQTAKHVARAGRSVPVAFPCAWELLSAAQTVVDICTRELSFNRNLVVEVAFAQLNLAWSQEAGVATILQHGETLLRLISGNHVYEELFLQFVFTRDRGHVHDEEAYRALLGLSQRLLSTTSETTTTSTAAATCKHRTFRGTVLLQLALSYMRSGDYANAATAAAESALLLPDTVEPRVAQLKALAHQGLKDEALCFFVDLAQRLVADGTKHDELFTLAGFLVDTNPTLSNDVAAFLLTTCAPTSAVTRTPAAPASTTESTAPHQDDDEEGDLARLTAFLLHADTDFSADAVVRLLSECATCVAHRRYYFSCLCGLHQPKREPRPLPRDVVTRALTLALTRFAADAASFEEAEAVLTELAALTLRARDATTGSPSVGERGTTEVPDDELVSLNHLFDAHSDDAKARQAVPGVPCLVLHAELLFHLGREDAALAIAHTLVAVPDVTLRCGAFGSLINGLLARDQVKAASDTAEVLLTSRGGDNVHAAFPSAHALMETAKVYVVGLLDRYSEYMPDNNSEALETVSQSLLDLLLETVSPTMQALVVASEVDAAVVEWWCKCFWHAAQLVVGTNLSAAVALTHAAVEWFDLGCRATAAAPGRMLVANRLSFLLALECDLFTAGCPWLTVPQLQAHVTRLDEWLPTNEAPPLSLCMARFELDVRRVLAPLSDTEAADTADVNDQNETRVRLMAHGGVLKAHGAQPDDLEALAAALERHGRDAPHVSTLLSQCAVEMELLALRTTSSDDTDDSSSWQLQRGNTLKCYKAYQMARSAGEQLRVVALARDALAAAAIAAAHQADVSVEDSTALECVAEYFTVEAWNAVVRGNASHDRTATLQWRDMAVSLAATLTPTSVTRSTVTEFAAKMPLL